MRFDNRHRSAATTVLSLLVLAGFFGIAHAETAPPSVPSVRADVSSAEASVQKQFQPLAPKVAPIDVSAPDPNGQPPVPNIDAYKAQLARISAEQRQIAQLDDEEQITKVTLSIYKNLQKIKEARGGPSAKAKPHQKKAPPPSPKPINKSARTGGGTPVMEVVDLGGIHGHETAEVYVVGVGQITAHVGSILPGNVRVASVTQSGVSVILSDGSERLIGIGGEIGGSSHSRTARHQSNTVVPAEASNEMPGPVGMAAQK